MTRHTPRRVTNFFYTRKLKPAAVRVLGPLMMASMLAACATTPQPQLVPVAQEAAQYRAHARSYYAAPGPASDPWGPYIEEASRRFDVPDTWIRAVMHQESGGHEFINGQFVTSLPGAMGLMQLMPPTYDDMRSQYSLGSDPYEPHDNIMAGTAYLRQMYEVYGSPGFLAAYNTGPGRLDDFLTRNRALPHETRQYVAIIGPQIAGIFPNSRSQADLMVMNHQASRGVQLAAAQTPVETRSVRMAWARRRDHEADQDQPVEVAEAPVGSSAAAPAYQAAWKPMAPARRAVAAPVPAGMVARNVPGPSVGAVWASRLAASPQGASSSPPAAPPSRLSAAIPTPSAIPARPVQLARAIPQAPDTERGKRHIRLVQPAMAERTSPSRKDAAEPAALHDWAIQVGAFGTIGQANEAAGTVRTRMHALLPAAHTQIAGIRSGRSGARIYRARLTGLSRDAAMQACQKLSRGRSECMIVSPDSST